MTIIGHKKLPDFLCVGVEKCGTTTLYDLLKQHPHIGLSCHKETHFFNSNWDKGIAWYEQKFLHLPDACQAIGEITPAYHRFKEAIPRIKQTLQQNLKIILMLREPRQRAFSHYIHDFALHQEVTDLVYKRYLATTAYAPVVKNYFEAFGKDNCLVLIVEEDVYPNQQTLMNKVCGFLGIGAIPVTPIHSNPSCLPIALETKNKPCRIAFHSETIEVPKNSLIIFTGQKNTTKILTNINPAEKKHLISKIKNAIYCIPALKSSIVFEQNVAHDLDEVETLLDRNLSIWKQPLGDLHARFAPTPELIPT